ncbi:MAG: hypothetical protein KDA32_00555 [Phycisphaerales bacterium]|nr:hypothetical protein [Phycisphaerales bacterium]
MKRLAIALGIAVAVALLAGGCSSKPGRPSLGAITPGFVELVEIKLEPTGDFTQEMVQPDGQLLYRSPAAIVNLADCDVNDSILSAVSGLYAIELKLKPAQANKYKDWVQSHTGAWVAHIVNGKVRYFEQLAPPPEDPEVEVPEVRPIVAVGPNREVAEKFLYWTQAGGSPDPADVAALDEQQ